MKFHLLLTYFMAEDEKTDGRTEGETRRTDGQRQTNIPPP